MPKNRAPDRGQAMNARFPFALLLACLLAALLPLAARSAAPHAPPAVTVAPVLVKDVAPSSSYIGRVVAIQSVKVVPRVTAFIENVPVRQGSDVKAGEVLFQLQKTQYQAALQSAQAKLTSAKAALAQAQSTYERVARLHHQGFEAQSNLDQATATRDQDQAAVLAAQANVTQAALDLSYCTIVSPIDGRIGAVTLTKGNLVTPSTPALATVNQLDPIRVVFSVSNRQVVSARQNARASPGKGGAGLVVGLVLPDGAKYRQTGRIAFVDNAVDPATGTVSIYADFPNPQRLLLPGAFVDVKVRRAQPEQRPLVPVEALQTDQNGSFVLLVGPDNKVKQQKVTLGRQVAQNYIVNTGLSGGERVIVAGVQKVKPGETVRPVPEPPPTQAEAQPGAAPSPPSRQGT